MPSSRHRNRFPGSLFSKKFQTSRVKRHCGNGCWWPEQKKKKKKKCLLLSDNRADLVVMMHVFFCLFVCDTAFRCTLEKTDLFVLVAVHMLRLHAYVSNKLDWIHKVTPVHMYKLCITLTQSSLCCRIQLVNQRVCVCVWPWVCVVCVYTVPLWECGCVAKPVSQRRKQYSGHALPCYN